MGGIVNYFHGEQGQVVAVERHPPELVIRLAEDPHRTLARDYGTDIGIDPQLSVGDWATYWRLDGTCGVWVQKHQTKSELTNCVRRVLQHRNLMETWARSLSALPERDHWADLYGLTDAPRTPASIFLSYSHTNALVAREIYRDLMTDAGLDVWFDMSRPGEAPSHESHVQEWLRTAIHTTQGYVLILSKAAAGSDWVTKEIKWALECAEAQSRFTPVVLQTDETPVPALLLDRAVVINVARLWSSKGLQEELYSALFGWHPRSRWLTDGPRLQFTSPEEARLTYSDFQSDAGQAVSLAWTGRKWKLRYENNLGQHRVFGAGVWEAVDPSIRPGDRIGHFVCRWRRDMHIDRGVSLWMRSDALDCTSDDALDAYYDRIGRSHPPKVKRFEYHVIGSDVYDRAISELILDTTAGRMLYQQYAMTYYNHAVRDSKALLESVLNATA